MSTTLENYRSYKGLPTLAGLATIAEAAKPGLSVEACVARLKRYHYAFGSSGCMKSSPRASPPNRSTS